MKIFGKIRFLLLEKGKTTHYLKYAIGEIFLVVLGILIALSVNNWNENKKEKKRTQQLLRSLFQEMQQDSIYLSNVYTAENELFLPSAQLLFRLHSDQGAVAGNDIELGRAFRFACFTPVIRYTDNAYTKLTSSDLFSQIRSESLKDLLHQYYSQINFLNRFSEQTYPITNNLIEELALYYEVIPSQEGDKRTISDFSGAAEEQFTASYSLEAFRKNRSLNPKLYDVIDIHKDRLGGLTIINDLRKEIKKAIKSEITD